MLAELVLPTGLQPALSVSIGRFYCLQGETAKGKCVGIPLFLQLQNKT